MQPTVVKEEGESSGEGFHSAVGYVVTVSIDDVFHTQLTCSPRFRDGHPLETPEGLLLAVALLRLCSEQQPGNKDHCTWCALGSNCSHSDLCSEQQATPQEARHG